jgi:thiosulfate dehydrogenase
VRLFAVAVAFVVSLSACGDTERLAPLAERGAALASDARVTRSQYNAFTCLTCHPVAAGSQGARLLPGAPLQGVTRRPTYWGGEVTHLREAVERCWTGFMRGVSTDLDGPDGQALGAWLESISPADSTTGTAAVAMSWPRVVRDPGDGGDRTRALALWGRGCASCHGAFETGVGRISPLASVLPRDTLAEHCDDDLAIVGYTDRQAYIRAIMTEKTRHGSFLGYAGVMPPFANEALSDAEMRDLASLFRCP